MYHKLQCVNMLQACFNANNNWLNCVVKVENSLTTCLTQIELKKTFLLELTLIET